MILPRPYPLGGLESHSREWGYEIWIVNDDYCGKLLMFKTKGLGTTLHYHRAKAETMLVRRGALRVDIQADSDRITHLLREGDAIDIPRFLRHRLTPDEDHTEVYEFSTHHRDDDSFRVGPRCHPELM